MMKLVVTIILVLILLFCCACDNKEFLDNALKESVSCNNTAYFDSFLSSSDGVVYIDYTNNQIVYIDKETSESVVLVKLSNDMFIDSTS